MDEKRNREMRNANALGLQRARFDGLLLVVLVRFGGFLPVRHWMGRCVDGSIWESNNSPGSETGSGGDISFDRCTVTVCGCDDR